MQPNNTTVVVESQLDWLTLAVHTERGTLQLRNLAEQWEIEELHEHNRSIPFRLSGYVGFRTGRVAWGERENAGLLQLSGDLARQHFRTVYPLRDNISRIDVAVTARLADSPDGLPQQQYTEASAFYSDRAGSARPSLMQDADRGATCYIGKRTSDYFFRGYLKQRECEAREDAAGAEHYRNCYRAELEVKGLAAPGVAKQAYDTPDPATWAQQLVHEYMTAHGVTPPFPATGAAALIGGFRRRSDYQTRVRWLERSVRPAVDWLRSHGGEDDIRCALGLDE